MYQCLRKVFWTYYFLIEWNNYCGIKVSNRFELFQDRVMYRGSVQLLLQNLTAWRTFVRFFANMLYI